MAFDRLNRSIIEFLNLKKKRNTQKYSKEDRIKKHIVKKIYVKYVLPYRQSSLIQPATIWPCAKNVKKT